MSARRYFRHAWTRLVPFAVVSLVAGQQFADEPSNLSTETFRQQIVNRGLEYLRTSGQSDEGMFSPRVGPGVTALALTAALRNNLPLSDPMVKAGLEALESYAKPDGGIYGNGRLRNYETCVAMLAFAEANNGGQYNEILAKAKAFVTGVQYGKADRNPEDPWYGGASYGGDGRPDLSNTGYLIEALRSLETPASDPAIQAALAFVSRTQNLDSKYNDTPFADKIDDGGFYYEIPLEKVDPSTSEERYSANGGLRSYGSMTYTGLKSMIYAGLTSDDPRVKAATSWISQNYDLENNPGMGTAGLYYYYHTFSAALNATGKATIDNAEGEARDWRADLVHELAKKQNEDGSWSNENRRWFENDKNLATSFALMALSYANTPSERESE
ncbi:MAG: prenyltransferase/squalene oxidase repeat-containing protein [Planctomycetota bacterium]